MKKIDMIYSFRPLPLGFCKPLSISGWLFQQRYRVRQALLMWLCGDGQASFLGEGHFQKPEISQVTTNRLLGHTESVWSPYGYHPC